MRLARLARVARLACSAALLSAACGDDPPAEPFDLSVVTYNVKGMDWGNTELPDFPEASSNDDILTTLRSLAPDVVGFQEVRLHRDATPQAEELAAGLGAAWDTYAVTVAKEYLPYSQQNAMVSRFPLAAREELELGPDGSDEIRHFQYAEVDLPNGTRLHLGNVHVSTDNAKQLPSLQLVETFLAGKLRPGDLFVWTGDFNFTPDTDRYAYVTESFSPTLLDPAAVLGGDPTAAELYSSDALAPHQRIDFVWVSPGIEVLSYGAVTDPVPNRTYPDHLAVHAVLRIPPP